MRYIVKKETTGRIGCQRFTRIVEDVKVCETRDEAIANLSAKHILLTSPKFSGKFYGWEQDFFVVIENKEMDCIKHFWIEPVDENAGKTVFSLSREEDERLHKFVEKHRQHGRSGAAGEFVRVFFCPTGLGTIAEVQCLVCGETETLTDLDDW